MNTPTPRRNRRHMAWRATAVILTAAVLALGFWAYTQPNMALSWEAVAALCGF